MTPEDDDLDPVQADEDPAPELSDEEDGGTVEAAAPQAAESEAEEVVVTIGDEPPAADEDPARAPGWLRDLRKANREKDRRIRELEAKVAASPAAAVVTLGPKPALKDCDYDEERFAAELEAWHGRKQQIDDAARKRAEAEQAAQTAWQAKIAAHERAKAALKVKDYDDAEQAVEDAFSATQRGIMVQGAKDSAALIYALGKNPNAARRLAAINDPVAFTWAVAQLETQLKVTPRKAAPLPERTVRGSAPIAGSVDSQLERLRAEAEKSGDYSKVHQYRQQLRAKRAA